MKEKNFSDIDKNFKQKESSGNVLKYYDVVSEPVSLEGLPFLNEDGRRSRLPFAAAMRMRRPNPGPCMQTAGGVIRFCTDSPLIGLRLRVDEYYILHDRRLSAGFDLYSSGDSGMCFLGNHIMEKPEEIHEFSWTLKNPGFKEYCIYLPVFCSFFQIELGIVPGSLLEKPASRTLLPIAFYGSSITNCGSSGRPGMLYPAIIGRMLGVETVNIGFGGNCFGEACIADEIAKLKLSALVLEYDHNAPDAEFLNKTHEAFFRCFRKLCPDLPVLMLSKADGDFTSEEQQKRRAIIARTWLNAFESGDRKVEFLDGETLFAGNSLREDCTSDGCHQNDLGQRLMAERISDRLKRMLK